ncbi:CYTH domain-containing protein [Neobacillus sp. SM06]|uniref:CYTH domain-containing protein n=1 Tax=Neobacillus sp. SM06 TaxID=3422492 RepID=UPI003D28B6A4
MQNLEIEFKNMLTKEEYERLFEFFKLEEDAIFTQENHYFDTADFQLKRNGAALRIREKNGQYELTLKQPYKEGLLETNELLSVQEAQQAISRNILPSGTVQQLIEKMGIPFSILEYFGSLVTKRAEIKDSNGLLVLDYSTYLNTEDYELEYEVENVKQGQAFFHKFLAKHGIPVRETKNKVRRFYERKYSMMNL